ncbi:hypothetical protein O3Q52_51875 [Streptomyces sp. ActVer]|uniref:hypothetical protein n=1 Tax=Streptomyces sp. ActVer TaxID=3014558 RepID=UPI0022B447CE|nr:hypothetical protein [Streptomyces sp. ActVer]MCZ4516468.1 hypothetical protein [Streptomyces sp. ActVer]
MRLHTTTVLSLTALALTGCSTSSAGSSDPTPSTAVSAHTDGDNAPASAPLSSAALAERLLDERDLGEDYIRQPQRAERHDDISVIGCPALEKLGGEAAVGGSFDFSHEAKVSFTYVGGGGSQVSEELYSDTEAKLSKGVGRIFDVMTSCPTYQVLVGSTSVTVTAQKVLAARLGDEQWSQWLTFFSGGRNSILKQTAVRTGTVVVVVSGSPGLVDAHVRTAVAKARVVRSTG